MLKDEVDVFILKLARKYANRLREAEENCPDPKAAGRQAEEKWIGDIAGLGGTLIEDHPKTCVTGAGGGQTKYDVVCRYARRDLYIEVQATPYSGGHKLAQAPGQLIGFAVARAGVEVRDRYYKIIAKPPVVHCWSSRDAAQKAFENENYEPQHDFTY